MKILMRLFFALFFVLVSSEAQTTPAGDFQPVPELAYRVVPDFFKAPEGMTVGEASGIALNSKGHIYLFQRAKPMLSEYDEYGNYLRSIGDGLFTHPHGLRIDADDNLWTTDDGSHLVLKLSPSGRVLLVLGKKDVAAESDWLFNQPTDVAFGKNGEIYVSDGYGNSRIIEFDHSGNFIRAWGKYGTGPGEFNLPHSVAVDAQGNVYVGDRENKHIQIFDAAGQYLKEWRDIGCPYGLYITPDQNVWMIAPEVFGQHSYVSLLCSNFLLRLSSAPDSTGPHIRPQDTEGGRMCGASRSLDTILS